MINRRKSNKIICFIVLLLASFAFMSISCNSINPFTNENVDGVDSSMFLVIGKGWANGLLPYVDLWDIKGPLIYFIDMLGFLTPRPYLIIFIIEVVFWLIHEIFIFKIISTEFNFQKSLIITVILLFFSTIFLGNCGNNVEDYCIPFISASVYCLILFLNSINNESHINHKPLYAGVYGLAFASCLLTRLTNAIAICCLVAVISILLIIKRNWKNLLENIMAFIAGAAILCLPFFIYYAIKGHLYDLFYGMLIYNFGYISNSSPVKYTLVLNLAKITILLFSSIILLMLGIVLTKSPKKYSDTIKGIIYIFVSVITIVYFIISNRYAHYFVIVIPYSALVIIEIKRISQNYNILKQSIKIYKAVIILFITFHVVVATVGSIRNINQLQLTEYNDLEIVENIDRKELEESFVAYNVNSGVYLKLDCFPCYKYFAFQDWTASRVEENLYDLRETYSLCKAKWILVQGSGENTAISDILDENYEIENQNNTYTLYKLK